MTSSPGRNGGIPWLHIPGYAVLGELGHGAFGKVVLARNLMSGAMVAIKLLDRGSYFSSSASNKPYVLYVGREILHQASLSHPFVVQVYEVFLSQHHLVIAMEYGDAGSLLTFLQTQRLPEATARWLFQQLVIGLAYCHHRGVANRDLKLENILLCSSSSPDRPLLKIGDFGYSKHDYNSSARTCCGTGVYMAPEIICCSGVYDAKKADVWSLGVVLYTIIVGAFPWAPGDMNCVQNIIAAKYYIPEGVTISDDGLELLSHLLCADPDKRWSMEQIQQHPWFLQDLPEGAQDMNDHYLNNAPAVGGAAQKISEILEHAAMQGSPDEQLMTCRFVP